MKRSSNFNYLIVKKARILTRSVSDPVPHSPTVLGPFDNIPFELKYRILSYLQIDDLLSFLRVSHASKFLVDLYIQSGQCRHLHDFYHPHVWASCNDNVTPSMLRRTCEKYQKIGILFRSLYHVARSSSIKLLEDLLILHMCDMGAKNRITAASKRYSRCTWSAALYAKSDETCSVGYLKCPALYLFGNFVRAFTDTWSESDKRSLFHTLVHYCFGENFWRRLTATVCQEPGADPASELTLRLFLRRLFLDPLALPQLVNPSCRSSRPNLSFRVTTNLTQPVTSTHDSRAHLTSSPRSQPSSLPSDSQLVACSSSSSTISLHLNDNFTADTTILNPPSICFTTDSPPSPILPHRALNALPISNCALPSSAPLVTRASAVQATVDSTSSSTTGWPAAHSLLRILQSYPFVQQARILFILYGPLHRGQLMWRTMCENTAADSEQLSACFGELGGVLYHMLDSGAWTPDETLSILDEITATPEDWLAENVACLLYTSGLRLASMVVTKKAVGGQIGDLAVTLTSLCLVRVKIRANLMDLVLLVGEACKAAEHANRRQFLDHLARSFQDVIVDLYETDELEDRIEDFSTILRAQAEFMRALMARVYEE